MKMNQLWSSHTYVTELDLHVLRVMNFQEKKKLFERKTFRILNWSIQRKQYMIDS